MLINDTVFMFIYNNILHSGSNWTYIPIHVPTDEEKKVGSYFHLIKYAFIDIHPPGNQYTVQTDLR